MTQSGPIRVLSGLLQELFGEVSCFLWRAGEVGGPAALMRSQPEGVWGPSGDTGGPEVETHTEEGRAQRIDRYLPDGIFRDAITVTPRSR